MLRGHEKDFRQLRSAPVRVLSASGRAAQRPCLARNLPPEHCVLVNSPPNWEKPCSGNSFVAMPGTIQRLSASFRAVAVGIVPEAVALDEDAWREVERIADGALAARPAAVHRQLRVFIRLLTVLPLLRYGRTLDRLSVERRAQFLRSIERAPLPLLRHGLWGLRTLVLMGYYARPSVAAALGYRASARGWAAVRGG